MPIARFQMPDGRVARFEVPEGTSPEQAQSMMQGFDFGAIDKPAETAQSAAENAQPLKDYEAKKARYNTLPSPLDLLSGAADKMGLGATGQYLDLGLRATADLPIGAAQAVTDIAAPDSLMAEALNKVATDTDRLQAQTPYGGLVRGGVQVAQTWPIGGGILSSGASGALQPVSGENASARNDQRLVNTGTGLAFGALAKGAAPVIKGAINKGSRVVGKGLDYAAEKIPALGRAADAMRAATPQLPKTGQELKDLTSKAYEKAAQTGGQIPASATDSFVSNLEALRPKLIAGKVLPSEGKALNDIIDEYTPLKGSSLNYDDVKALDQSFGDKITSALATGNKTVARSLQDIQAKFRNIIDDTTQGLPQLAEARKMAAAGFKMDDIERIMQRAEMANNPAQAARTAFSNLYNNAKKSRGYTKEELALIKQAGSGSLTMEALRGIGSRLSAVISLATGENPAQTAALTVGSAGARKLMEKSQLGKGQKVIEAISNRVVPQQTTAIGNFSKGVAEATRLAPRVALPSITAQSPMVQTPPVTLPGASKPSTMPVTPLEAMPQAQPAMKPQSSIQDTIQNVANNTGVDPDLLHGIAQAESGLNPNAKSQSSTASGLMQITKPTWKSLVVKYGKQYGFGMSDIMNPEANATAGALLASDNAMKLSNKLGREPDNAELYMAHFLGANKAIKLLNANPRDNAVTLFPAEAYANRNIFFYKDGRPRDVYGVRQILSNRINKAINSQQQFSLNQIPQPSIKTLGGNPQLAGDFNQMYTQ